MELGGTEQGETAVPHHDFRQQNAYLQESNSAPGPLSVLRALTLMIRDSGTTHKLVTLGPPESTKDQLNSTSVTGHLGTRRGRRAAMSGSEDTAQRVTSS